MLPFVSLPIFLYRTNERLPAIVRDPSRLTECEPGTPQRLGSITAERKGNYTYVVIEFKTAAGSAILAAALAVGRFLGLW
jgi:hypothetical protein